MIVFLLSAVSITHIVVGSSLFGPIRLRIIESESKAFQFLKELVTCYQCSGFWVGVLMFFVWALMFGRPLSWSSIPKAFLIAGPLVSLLSDLAYRLKKYLCEEY